MHKPILVRSLLKVINANKLNDKKLH